MIKSNVYLVKIIDKWKIGKWLDIKKWIIDNFKDESEEIIKDLIYKWKQKN